RHGLRGIAADLGWIRRKGEPAPKGRKTLQEVAFADEQSLATAIQTLDWHNVLHCLRLCAPLFQPASLARERAIAYAAIGLPKLAHLFAAQALEMAHSGVFFETQAHSMRNGFQTFGVRAIAQSPVNAVVSWEEDGVRSARQATTPVADVNYQP